MQHCPNTVGAWISLAVDPRKERVATIAVVDDGGFLLNATTIHRQWCHAVLKKAAPGCCVNHTLAMPDGGSIRTQAWIVKRQEIRVLLLLHAALTIIAVRTWRSS